MLEKILSGAEDTKFCIIEDSTEQPSRSIFKLYVSELTKKNDEVKLLLTEDLEENFLSGLAEAAQGRITIYDGYTDSCNWDGTNCNAAERLINDVKASPVGKVPIMICSLSPLLMRSSANVYRLLHLLTSCKGCQVVIANVHIDMHDDSVIVQLEYLASTIVRVKQNMECSTQHKKPTGKVIKKTEVLTIADDYSLDSCKELVALKMPPGGTTVAEPPNPAANLSFSLTLRETEKEARSQLVLLYTHKRSDIVPVVPSGGQIFYQPDEADDFDEDDPDDDLDI
ncbi:PREDICTED: elongator complex protein 5-like [Priapulus caudatus]|uniref:Elongator complex protein 5 n=1 Tax=Priapulus caudatus TaxID=37621 RepID=A0ABM1FB73_PRICU|nr:PREDICTED: elongator complex protein 5-like [Priapulus caudatus]